MKILLLDIETSPNVAYVWSIWKENIPLQRLIDSGGVLCFAAKWLGSDEIIFSSVTKGKKKMLKQVHKLLDEADAVVHYNGVRFDIPTLNKEFLLAGMTPPASYKQIDLLQTVKQKFRFVSNKLDYVGKALGVGQKTQHEGFGLWVQCMAGDPDAWQTMEEYNKNDVVLLEKVYYRLLPWIKNHPNHGVVDGLDKCCPNCGSEKLTKRGFALTAAGKYQRYQCNGCGAWSRGRKSIVVKNTLTIDRN